MVSGVWGCWIREIQGVIGSSTIII